MLKSLKKRKNEKFMSENNSNIVTNPLKYTCMFGGGAVRGMAYIGAIRALEELNVEFDIIAGSSVGSIFAALVACGYKSYELENIFMKVNFELFKDIHLGIGKPFAISRGEIFIDWLNELISRKFPEKKKNKLTFEDLEKELVIFSTDLRKFKNYEFSKNNSQYFEIARAIRISSSMPGLMPPYEYNGRSLVDGDLQKGSPMWDSSETLKNTTSRILEFRLEGDYSSAEKNPISFINTIYSCVTSIATDFMVSLYGQNDRYDIININTGDIFFADLNLNEEGRKKLIDIGYQVTMDYFKTVLPPKKEGLLNVYSQVLKFLKEAQKGLKINNVEEVQWWFGDLFMILCENKDLVDPCIYNKIIELKQRMMDSVTTMLFFHAKFKDYKELIILMDEVIEMVKCRLTEIELFISVNRTPEEQVAEAIVNG